MLNHQVLIINKPKRKLVVGQKTVVMPIFWPPYINLKPNLYMEPKVNILTIFIILQR